MDVTCFLQPFSRSNHRNMFFGGYGYSNQQQNSPPSPTRASVWGSAYSPFRNTNMALPDITLSETLPLTNGDEVRRTLNREDSSKDSTLSFDLVDRDEKGATNPSWRLRGFRVDVIRGGCSIVKRKFGLWRPDLCQACPTFGGGCPGFGPALPRSRPAAGLLIKSHVSSAINPLPSAELSVDTCVPRVLR
ncbi:hypothetical protein KM043_014639 [Ampulex compressa]|nr:hypothetical protein KM043_014639 [Ampulex compressa]